MAVQEKRFTADELWEYASRIAESKRLELIEGEIHQMPPASALPSVTGAKLSRLIGNFVEEHGLGYVTGADGGFILSESNVFVPDVGFIAKARQPTLPERYFPLPPDLAVEVVSPTDAVKDVLRKARRYLAAGTQLVWLVYPEDRSVDVCRAAEGGGMNVQELTVNDVLDGGDVLPGFQVPVREIFPT